MSTPGALTSGLISFQKEGPRLLKEAMASSKSVAPTEKDSGKPAGVAIEPSPSSPLFPALKTGKIPAARRACTSGRKVRSATLERPGPHELLTTSGALLGSGLLPSRAVGASSHWKPA